MSATQARSAARAAGLRISILAVAVALATTGCTSSSSSSAPSPDPTATTTPPVAGVIAIGHSGLTGEGTAAPFEPALQNSWATGTSPEVNSVYLRLSDVRPEDAGHVANRATGGAVSDSLAAQASSALDAVPYPELVIISTIDNDIRCDGTDDENIVAFGAHVDKALDLITAASPDSTILVVGQLGRPSVSYIETLVAHDPAAKAPLSGTGPCPFFDPAGNLIPANFANLTAIIQGYEDEETRVCAKYPQCHVDGGVRAAYLDVLENFSSDWAHLNVRGQAAEAELIWPVVASILGL